MFDYKNEAEIRRYQQMLRIEAGRKVLDQINGKTRQIRQDGYINLLNKYGTAQDNSTAYQWEPETPVTDYELTELYQGGSLFAKIIDAPADEAVKNGIDLGVTDEKAREYIEDTLAWLEWDENISTALKWSRLYGGSIAVMMIDDGGGLDEPLNLGNIRGIDEIRVYDRSIAIPDYTSIYKLDPSSNLSSRTGSSRFRHRFLEPEFYDVASIYGSFRVHESRCLVFRNGKVPERSSLTQYRHWGLPEYIRIRKELREAVTSVSYSVKMLEKSVQAIYGMKNLQELLTTDEGEDIVLRRLRVIDMARNFLNSIAIDSDGETYDFKSMTLSGVKDIVETTFATISAVSNVPQTVLFGRSPAGENATGDGDLENWYSYVQRIWKVDVKSNLKYLVDIIIKAGMAQGYITEDPKPKIEMNPLWSLSETEQATVDQTKAATEQTKATTLQLYVDMQAIGPDEVRAALKKEGTLDISSMLDDLPEDETWGLGEEIEGTPTDPFQTPQGRLTEAQGASQTSPGDNSLPQEENADTGDLTGQGPGTKITGVGTIVVKDGRVLVGRRKSDFCAGTICGPGGHIEAGESGKQAAVREAREEFGITIDPADLYLVGVDDTLPSEFGGSIFYLATDFAGDPKCDDVEMTNAQFTDASELMEREEGLFPPFAASLKQLARVLSRPQNLDSSRSDLDWITMNKAHVPLDDGGSVHSGGQRNLQGKSFSGARSTKSGSSGGPSASKSTSSKYQGETSHGLSEEVYSTKKTEWSKNAGHELSDVEVQEMVDATADYTRNYKDVVAASAGYSGVYESRGRLMDDEEKAQAEKSAESIEKMISLSDKYTGKVERAMTMDPETLDQFSQSATSGEAFGMGHLSSWTTSEDGLRRVFNSRNSENDPEISNVVLECTSKSGAPIKDMAEVDMDEVLFSKNARFKVVGVDPNYSVGKYGAIKFTLEEVDPEN